MRDYPTDEELQKIREWPISDADRTDIRSLLEYVKTVGNYWPDGYGWKQDGNRYLIATGGWSGNEEIIAALQENMMFWLMCWQCSRRGGHYEFEIPK